MRSQRSGPLLLCGISGHKGRRHIYRPPRAVSSRFIPTNEIRLCLLRLPNKRNPRTTNEVPIGSVHGGALSKHLRVLSRQRIQTETKCYGQRVFESSQISSFISKCRFTTLAEPDNHRANAAERAIQTFKNHFIAGLATVDPTFPLQLWCYLLTQAKLTLNLLRTLRQDPTKSAYASLNQAFDWNRTPLAPPGTKALIYEAPANRTSWAPHAVDGWYLCPAMEHYRCGLFFIESTPGIRVANAT